MSIYEYLSVVLLCTGLFWGVYGCTHGAGAVKTSTATVPTAHWREGEAVDGPRDPSGQVDTPVVPFSGRPDSLGGWPWPDSAAVRASRIDPGILIYTDPPSGTNMPTLEPPKHVDPEMIWPLDP